MATASDDGKTVTIGKMKGQGGAGGGAGIKVYCACIIGGISLVCGVDVNEDATVSCLKCTDDKTCPMFAKPIKPDDAGVIRWKKLVIKTGSN